MVDMGNPVVDKNILDIINKNQPHQNVEITQVKIQPKQQQKKKAAQSSKFKNKGSVTVKTITLEKSAAKKKKTGKTKTVVKKTTVLKHMKVKPAKSALKESPLKHVKDLKKHVKSL